MTTGSPDISAHYKNRLANPRLRDAYSIFSPWNLAVLQERQRALQVLLRGLHEQKPLSSVKVLDLGCGSGQLINELINFGVQAENIYGIDLFQDRITLARAKTPSAVKLSCGDFLEFEPKEKIDIIFMFTVLTSIPDPELRLKVLQHAHRLLVNNGNLVIYDFDRLRSFKAAEFLRPAKVSEIAATLKMRVISQQRLTPHYFLGQRLSLTFPLATRPLFWTNLLKTHYLARLEKH